jgi:hypothetical protein
VQDETSSAEDEGLKEQFRDTPDEEPRLRSWICLWDTILWRLDLLPRPPTADDLDAAEREVLALCGSGELGLWGYRDAIERELEPVPVTQIPSLEFILVDGQPTWDRDKHGGREYGAAYAPASGGSAREAWTGLCFKKADVLRVYGQPFDVAPLSTGAPGRRTSMHLVRVELERRALAGEVLASMTAEAEALAAWLPQKHPEYPPLTPKTIRNALARRFRELAAARK